MKDKKLIEEENRRIRYLRILVDLQLAVIMSGGVTLEESYDIVGRLKEVAESLFPGKGHVFDLVCLPRFRRAISEIFRAN